MTDITKTHELSQCLECADKINRSVLKMQYFVAFFFFCVGCIFFQYSAAETLSDKISRFVQGEADTIFSIRHVGKTVPFFNAGRCVVYQEMSPRETQISYLEPEHGVVWSKNYNIPVLYSRLVAGESGLPRVLVGYGLNEDQYITEVLNDKGNQLARIEDKVFLDPSPSGVFFYTQTEIIVGNNALNVYDSLGNLLWSKVPKKNYWLAKALSDSFLVYLDQQKLQILDARTGVPQFEISGDSYGRDENLLGKFVASNDGNYFILTGKSTLFSFSREKGFLWSVSFEKTKEFLGDAAISPDGRFLLVMTVPSGSRGQRELKLLNNSEQGKEIWSLNYNVNKLFMGAYYSSLEFASDSLITVILPSGNDVYVGGLTLTTATKYLYVNSLSGALIDTGTVKGLLSATSIGSAGSVFALGRLESGQQVLLFKRNLNRGKK